MKSGTITIYHGLLSNYFKSNLIYKSQGSIVKGNWKINSLNAGDTATLILKTSVKKSGIKKITTSLNDPKDEIKIKKSINIKNN